MPTAETSRPDSAIALPAHGEESGNDYIRTLFAAGGFDAESVRSSILCHDADGELGAADVE